MIIILLLDIWYSWTPVLLNSCILEPLKRGDSWYYTHVYPRNWITMNIGLLWIPCGHYHWTICNNWITCTGMGKTDEYRYSLHVYDGIKVSHGHILGFDLEAIRCFHGVYWHPYFPACQVCHKPLGLFLWEQWHLIHVRAYNKSWYQAVRSSSVPNTPRPLSRACTGPILSMVHRSPSVSTTYSPVCMLRYVE